MLTMIRKRKGFQVNVTRYSSRKQNEKHKTCFRCLFLDLFLLDNFLAPDRFKFAHNHYQFLRLYECSNYQEVGGKRCRASKFLIKFQFISDSKRIGSIVDALQRASPDDQEWEYIHDGVISW